MESKKKSTAYKDYWDGLGSPKQDKWLENSISPLDEDASYFDLVSEFKSLTLSDDIESNILRSIPPEHNRDIAWWKLAAAVAVIVGACLTIFKQSYPVDASGLTPQEQIELDMTREALLLMSSKLNEGLSFTYSLGQFDEAITTLSE